MTEQINGFIHKVQKSFQSIDMSAFADSNRKESQLLFGVGACAAVKHIYN